MLGFLPSLRLNIRRLSLMFAARRCAIEAIRRRFDLADADVAGGFAFEFEGVSAVRGEESRCDTKLLTWLRGQTAAKKQKRAQIIYIQSITLLNFHCQSCCLT